MTTENVIQLLVPVAGIMVAAVSAALSYYFAKKAKIASDERGLKEKYYLAYINALSNNVLSDDVDDAKSKLSVAHNNILLIGSVDVVIKLRAFSIYISNSTNVFSQDRHNELLTDLIRSMRNDLYQKRKMIIGYPTVAVSGKHHR